MAVQPDHLLLDDPRIEINRPSGNVDYQPSSVDLHLSNQFGEYKETDVVEVEDSNTYPEFDTFRAEEYVIEPGEFVLASTQETVKLWKDLVGFLWGRSSVGRLGLFVENAGLIDAGFQGQLTLELFNASKNSIKVSSGMSIVQMSVHEHSSSPEMGYGEKQNKYQNQSGPTESRLTQDFDQKT